MRLLFLQNVFTCNSPDMEVQSTPYDTLTSVFGKSFFAQINFRDDEFLPSYG